MSTSASSELAVDNADNQQHQYGDDSDGDDPIRCHPIARIKGRSVKHILSRLQQGVSYLLAMPLRVLTLRST